MLSTLHVQDTGQTIKSRLELSPPRSVHKCCPSVSLLLMLPVEGEKQIGAKAFRNSSTLRTNVRQALSHIISYNASSIPIPPPPITKLRGRHVSHPSHDTDCTVTLLQHNKHQTLGYTQGAMTQLLPHHRLVRYHSQNSSPRSFQASLN